MIKNLLNFYLDSYRGFRPEVWWIAAITFINRAGTMVIPFLSIYLIEDANMSIGQVGWIMSAFGLGSVAGSWLGGKISDRFGFYSLMFWSLILSGISLIALQSLRSFETICAGVFLVMLVSDALRPAIYVALRVYSKPENRTRAVSLIRMAINLGFSMGPAIGGLIIASIGYSGLFWVDGITCMLAAVLLITALSRKSATAETQATKSTAKASPYKDGPYLFFLFIMFLIGACFLQYFSTVPVYYHEVHHLSEFSIGLLLGGGSAMIFIAEMPLIKLVERDGYTRLQVLVFSTILIAISFLILNFSRWNGILVIGMFLMTLGEMLNFPFMNRIAMDRSDRGQTGAYMALFTIAFSLGHIIGPNAGMQLIDKFGYEFAWYIMTAALLVASGLFFVLRPMLNKSHGEEIL